MSTMFDSQLNRSDDSFLSPIPFDPAYCDLFMNDFAYDLFDQSIAPGYSLDDASISSPQESVRSHSASDVHSPTIASSASSISSREESGNSETFNYSNNPTNHHNHQESIKQSNEPVQRTSRANKRKAASTTTLSNDSDKPFKHFRQEFPRLGCLIPTTTADETRIITHFSTAVRNILTLPSTPHTDADILYTISHLMDVLRPDLFQRFLTTLNYSSTASPCAQDAERCIWKSDLRLPTVTLPHRQSMDWSRSSLTPIPDEPNSLNIATLVCQRPEAVTLHKFRDSFVALEAGASKLLNDDNFDRSNPIPLDQVDVSYCSVPISVQANCAFERLFGYTQQEVRSLFLREGKGALYVLNDREELLEIHRKNVRSIMEGKTEFCGAVGINTKYGSTPLKTLIMMKQFMNESSCTMKKLSIWIPMPNDSL